MAAIEKEFGDIIRKLRKDKGYSQDSFADHAGIDRSYQGRIERGEASVTLRMIQILSKSLKVPMNELMSQLENKKTLI